MSHISEKVKGLALVIGTGGLGSAMAMHAAATYEKAVVLGRASDPPIDYEDEGSLRGAALWLGSEIDKMAIPLRLMVVASGFLHGAAGQPERSWSQLDPLYLRHVFLVNAIGPALAMKHFLPLLPRQGRSVAAFV